MNFEKLDKLMEEMPSRGLPATDILITKSGETIYRKMAGFSDAAGTKPVTNRDLYWLFSATKVITCIAGMRLLEEGKIKLDDPVSKYLPGFANLTVKQKDGTFKPAENVMTVEHLFTMSTGMDYELKSPYWQEGIEKQLGTVELVNEMAKQPLHFEPGTNYRYSLSHDVLAAVIEVVSGMRFSDYLKKIMFEPLEVDQRNIGFVPDEEQKSRISAQYAFRSGYHRAVEVPTHNQYWLTPSYESGGAGLFATVEEYSKIITAVACNGKAKNGYQLLKPETVALAEVNRLCEAGRNSFSGSRLCGYGWGLCGRVHTDPHYSFSLAPVGEFGWDGAAAAFALIDRKNELALFFDTHVLGCNYAYHVLHPMIRNLLYMGLEE